MLKWLPKRHVDAAYFGIHGPMVVVLAVVGSAVLVLATCALSQEAGEKPSPARQVLFRNDIEPILRRHCFSCHANEKQESGLRLDSRARTLVGGDRGPAMVVGDSRNSRLIQVVRGQDAEVGRMPPDDQGRPLAAEQIEQLRAWIDQGAEWPEDPDIAPTSAHWSFQPIKMTVPPTVYDREWVRSPVDAFVRYGLEERVVEPSPRAPPETWLRRIYLDLLGLLPSIEDLADFLDESLPDRSERTLDRVIASPAYGERWGRHWLDLARYADSDGYEKDKPRPFAWRYRQWVIDSLNADMPFDLFSAAQIAGDLLVEGVNPEVRTGNQIATGFHRNTLHNTEGGADPEEDRVKKTVDRTNTLGTVWLGLTLSCAQCHSHKYDPITQREYYSIYAFFNGLNEVEVDAPNESERMAWEKSARAHEAESLRLKGLAAEYETTHILDSQREWEQRRTVQAKVWSAFEFQAVRAKHGAMITTQPDQSLLVAGPNVLSDEYELEVVWPFESLSAVRLEVLPDPSLPKQGPGRSENGNFVLSTMELTLLGDHPPRVLPLALAASDFSQAEFDISKAINGNERDGWAVSPQTGNRHVAVFELAEPVRWSKVDNSMQTVLIRLVHHYGGPDPHNLGRFRLSGTADRGSLALEEPPDDVMAALKFSATERSTEMQLRIREYYRSIDTQRLRNEWNVQEWTKKAPRLPADLKAQVVVESPDPRSTYVHLRGDFLSPGDQVEPATLSVLPAANVGARRGQRIDLVNWLFSEHHPLTARVAANRCWQHLFLRGLVASEDDFGTQGERPSHPELLDWLSVQYRTGSWSTKLLQRRVMVSATYAQSAFARPELVSTDPENVWLARQARRRVEAELIRDLALDASGLLDRRIGGPSVRPKQPGDHALLTYANSANWTPSTAGDAYRRGMYTFFQRTSPFPMLSTFDAPDSNESCVRRAISNTPLQALMLWNDPQFVEMAQNLADRIAVDDVQPAAGLSVAEARVGRGLEICLTRKALPSEVAELSRLYERQLSRLDNAETINAVAGRNGAEREKAAWVAVARILLNLDEFVTRE